MISVFSCTNRPDSGSILVANQCCKGIREYHGRSQLFNLEEIPEDIIRPDMYEKNGQSRALRTIQEKYLLPVKKFVFVIPEYNGGIPGILKLFIDACSVYKYNESFSGKKACLVGVSDGRAGNLRGMDHFTGVLNYLNVVVMPNKLPVSRIKTLMDEERGLSDRETIHLLNLQMREFVLF